MRGGERKNEKKKKKKRKGMESMILVWKSMEYYGFVWKLFVFCMDFWTPFLGFSYLS